MSQQKEFRKQSKKEPNEILELKFQFPKLKHSLDESNSCIDTREKEK